jgi:hypothetical protein
MEDLKSKISFLITTRSIVINYESKTFIVSNEAHAKKYESLKQAFKDQNFEKIVELIIPKEVVIKYSNDFFIVDDKGHLFMKDDTSVVVPKLITKTLMLFVEEELPIEPLINFWKKLRNNPLGTAREDLFTFLETNSHPMTPDGNFIAYKRVDAVENGKLVDNYTKKLDNTPGAVVSMPRSEVDSNRNNTCSRGLHVAAWEYAQTYSGNTLIEVLVNPEDVVSVPTDYNNQKMRVCRYKVLNIVGKPREETLTKNVHTEDEAEVNVSTANEGNVVVFTGKTAREIIELAQEKLGVTITMSLKNKQPIIKKATALFVDNGWKVE